MMYQIWENLATCSLMEGLTPEGWIIVDVRDLSDVEKNIDKIRAKISIISGLMSLGCKIAVRCVGGINRSNCLAVATMCYMDPQGSSITENWNFHRNWAKSKVNRLHISPELERTCKKTLKEMMKDFKE
jgi:protein-tyrosine phosphatase